MRQKLFGRNLREESPLDDIIPQEIRLEKEIQRSSRKDAERRLIQWKTNTRHDHSAKASWLNKKCNPLPAVVTGDGSSGHKFQAVEALRSHWQCCNLTQGRIPTMRGGPASTLLPVFPEVSVPRSTSMARPSSSEVLCALLRALVAWMAGANMTSEFFLQWRILHLRFGAQCQCGKQMAQRLLWCGRLR